MTVWIAWAGMGLFWLAGWSWMTGFGRIMRLPKNDDSQPTHAIHLLSLGLCLMAGIEAIVALVFMVYGVGGLWTR